MKKAENSTDTHDYKWWVPITYTTSDEMLFNETKPKMWMKPSQKMMTLEGMPTGPNDWVILNIQQSGYYRVNYDQKTWDAIIKQLLENHMVFSTITRAQIIDDAFNLARSGKFI